MNAAPSALAMPWLPKVSDFRGRLRALRDVASSTSTTWSEARLLANSQTDFTQVSALDQVVQKIFAGRPPEGLATDPTRLAILGSSTFTHLQAGIRVGALRRGMWATIYENHYGQYLQELLDSNSGLHQFQPTAILFAFDARHVSAGVHASLGAAEVDVELESVCARIAECWDMAHSKFQCAILQQTIMPALPELIGGNEHRLPGSRADFINRLNARLRKLARARSVDLVAIDRRIAQDGLQTWYDPALWCRAKQEVSFSAAPLYGDLVARLLAAKMGRSAKCLVLDLDNTIWGGVIGDDGLDGIALGHGSALGEAFSYVQEYALELARRGVILAVCSKNDEANALEAFDSHREMLLRREHIASFVANWNDKASNLRAIAQELNIGLDALVFLDDNPVERGLVRQELPMVAVPEAPDDPALVPRMLSDAGYFEAVAITTEDRQRTRLYQQNREHRSLKASASDLASYLKGMEMRLHWQPLDQSSLPRAVQLINKTNQFNLTTRRHSEDDVRSFMKDPSCFSLNLRLTDRFGDNGVIAITLGKVQDNGDAVIDTWLMSCRVLGRQVEHATLNLIAAEAGRLGAKRLIGEYRPTQRNNMVKDHYEKLGFVLMSRNADGVALSSINLADFSPLPTYIEIMEG
ncbi:HAD-IIIC family phosphatase [Methylocystis sp. JAN1]|uniref:HAD-IIIC family phosphatase n=1 Tax=Methylocystis sp. JAN1 TaxID=3397211 RepID=UPI003FA26546